MTSILKTAEYLPSGEILLNNSVKLIFDKSENFTPKAEFDRGIINEQNAILVIDEFLKILDKSLGS